MTKLVKSMHELIKRFKKTCTERKFIRVKTRASKIKHEGFHSFRDVGN